jgi:hypothetical protein
MGYGLYGPSLIPCRGKQHSVQTGSGAHPASYPVGTRTISSGVKRPMREADSSSPPSDEFKNSGAIPPLP